jgi:hypothetical protein
MPTMLSESARMSSTAEARFRIQAPNSVPRAITVIALDTAGEAVVRRLAKSDWTHATFLTALSPDTTRDLAGQTRSIRDEVDTADLVVLVAGPGGGAHAASTVGQACRVRRVMTTACVVGGGSAPESDLSRTLAQLRPWSLMVVMAKDDEYIHDMMTALRA